MVVVEVIDDKLETKFEMLEERDESCEVCELIVEAKPAVVEATIADRSESCVLCIVSCWLVVDAKSESIESCESKLVNCRLYVVSCWLVVEANVLK